MIKKKLIIILFIIFLAILYYHYHQLNKMIINSGKTILKKKKQPYKSLIIYPYLESIKSKDDEIIMLSNYDSKLEKQIRYDVKTDMIYLLFYGYFIDFDSV